MVILSIDASSEHLSIAISLNGVIKQRVFKHEKASKILLLEIEKMLMDHDVHKEALNYIVFNKGPGSFTGTRVASSVIQAIALVHNIPVIGLSSMWLMAFHALDIRKFEDFYCIRHAYSRMFYLSHFNNHIKKDSIQVNLIEEKELTFKQNSIIITENDNLVNTFNTNEKIEIINLSENNKFIDAKSMIESLNEADFSNRNFNLHETFPDYADHEI